MQVIVPLRQVFVSLFTSYSFTSLMVGRRLIASSSHTVTVGDITQQTTGMLVYSSQRSRPFCRQAGRNDLTRTGHRAVWSVSWRCRVSPSRDLWLTLIIIVILIIIVRFLYCICPEFQCLYLTTFTPCWNMIFTKPRIEQYTFVDICDRSQTRPRWLGVA